MGFLFLNISFIEYKTFKKLAKPKMKIILKYSIISKTLKQAKKERKT